MDEIWKDIVGFEGLYQVSNLGRVKSLGRVVHGVGRGFPRFKKPSFLKPCFTGTKYYFVILTDYKGNHKMYLIHRLVAETFIPNPFKKGDVNHIDGNKLNNVVSNLEWNTRKENIQHAFRFGLSKPHHNQVNRKRVEVVERNGNVHVFSCIADAAIYLNVSQSGISRACSGKLKKTGGCVCRFV